MNKIKAVLLVANEADTEFEAKLQTLGYEVFSVISDTEALKTITDNSSINMILLDIKLLKIWEANKDVQSSLKKRNLPVLCVVESESDINRNNYKCDFSVILKSTSGFAINQIISLAFDLNMARYKASDTQNNLVAILDIIPDLVWLKDINGIYMYCNIRFENFYGAKKAEIIGKTDYDFTDKNTADFFRENDKKAIESGSPSFNEETLTFANDGHTEHCETVKVPTYDLNGKVYGVIGVSRDISEFKNTEKTLLESMEREQFLADIYRKSPVAIAIGYPDGKLDESNEEFSIMTGYTSDELKNIRWNEVLTPLKWKEFEQKILSEINTKNKIVKYEKEYIKKDGTVFPVSLSVMGNFRGDGTISYYTGYIQDISDLKIMESDLRNSQRLKAIGTLAGGIAHEINNPINGIMNYSQLILDESKGNENLNQYAREIIFETNRVAEIVKNLLRFSREEVGEYSSFHMEELIDKTLSLIRTIIKRDQITIELDIEENLPSLTCRGQQIQQVLMNLLTNARDALNEKYEGYDENKKIIITCSKIIRENHGLIRTSVKDFGNGIPSEIANDVFNPFFTTKRGEKGTGLGLSISYSIIKEHNGNFYFTTEEGKFTKFCVDLPAENFIE